MYGSGAWHRWCGRARAVRLQHVASSLPHVVHPPLPAPPARTTSTAGVRQLGPSGLGARTLAQAAEAAPLKILGLGLSRTGTASLAAALRSLGLRTAHYPLALYDPDGGGDLERYEEYDALVDLPVPLLFARLQRRWPEARAILTVREREEWLASCATHLGRPFSRRRPYWWSDDEQGAWSARSSELGDRLRREVYGSSVFDRDLFERTYDRHERAVLDAYEERPEHLLVLDICRGQGWQPLCKFLGLPAPDRPFPRRNRHSSWRSLLRRVVGA